MYLVNHKTIERWHLEDFALEYGTLIWKNEPHYLIYEKKYRIVLVRQNSFYSVSWTSLFRSLEVDKRVVFCNSIFEETISFLALEKITAM